MKPGVQPVEQAFKGPRIVLTQDHPLFPNALKAIPDPPEKLYVIGNPEVLQEGLAVIGARKATEYGLGCARKFAGMAAERGVVIISGGARGCDGESHRAALAAGGKTVVILGGGCDQPYPAEHRGLFQMVIDTGGALVSEEDWGVPPLPYMFRRRNRLIAGLARATLIVEAGLPSGTFSTADDALAAGKEVLVIPGAITSPTSRGANRLLAQGAVPVVDHETFQDVLFNVFGCLKIEDLISPEEAERNEMLRDPVIALLAANPLTLEELCRRMAAAEAGSLAMTEVVQRVARAELLGVVVRSADGRYGVTVA